MKLFDAKELFDPFEEQVDLSVTAIKIGDVQGRKIEVIGQEHELLVVLGIVKFDAP